jgi:hypothetical protein
MRGLVVSLLCFTLQPADARTWTDVKGRTIEADIVRKDGAGVIVKKGGKEVRLPLQLLSEADKKFVEKWEEEGGAPAEDGVVTKTGDVSLGGQAIEKGGKMNLIEQPFSAETLKDLSKKKDNKEESLKLAVSVPEGFDPAVPQKYFIAVTAVNNEGERARGNIGVFRGYTKVCAEAGWACITIDTNNGCPKDVHAMDEAMALLEAEWPGFRDSTFATGGFSGGSKGCWWYAAYMVKNKFNVVGVFMGGCNADRSESYRRLLKASSAKYRKIRGYVSIGRKDTIATVAHGERVMASLKSNRIRDLRSAIHEGGHSKDNGHFLEALKWFAEP